MTKSVIIMLIVIISIAIAALIIVLIKDIMTRRKDYDYEKNTKRFFLNLMNFFDGNDDVLAAILVLAIVGLFLTAKLKGII